jgi:endogenous inhibitor of DNA gyrase (YacG/DUF329 family)
MTKLNYNRPKRVPRDKRLDSGGVLPMRHGGTALGPMGNKGNDGGRVNDWMLCSHCTKQVLADNIGRHRSRCSAAKRFDAVTRRKNMGRAPCPLCQKSVLSIRSHVLDKHGFDLTPNGGFVIRCGFNQHVSV